MKKLFFLAATCCLVMNLWAHQTPDQSIRREAKEQRQEPRKIHKNTQDGYGLWVGDVEVTSANKDNIPCSGKLIGTISYDPTTSTLTLDGVQATIDDPLVYTDSDVDIIIQVLYTNQITCPNHPVLELNGDNSTIQGTGTLECYNKGSQCDGIRSSHNLTIQGGVTLKVYGGSSGIGIDGSLVIDQSILFVQGNGSVKSIYAQSMTMTGCDIVRPFGAEFIPAATTVSVFGMTCNDEIVIAPSTDNYGITIGGVPVSPYICSDVLGDGTVSVTELTSGSYAYEIKLNGVQYNVNAQPFISTDKNVKLFVGGENENNEIGSYLEFDGNVEVSGDGLLHIYGGSVDGDGIRFAKNLIFASMTARTIINVSHCGLIGTSASAYCELNGAMQILGNGSGSAINATYRIHHVGEQQMAEMTNGVISDENKRIEDSNGNASKYFEVLPNHFNIYFDYYNTTITRENYTDVFGDGKVSYSPTSAILTLKNCSIQCTEGAGLNAYRCFRIHLEGNNLIEGTDYGFDVDDASIWIEGPGSLVVRSTEDNGIAMSGVGPFRVFDGAHVEAYGDLYGVTCYGEQLEVDSATLIAQTGSNGIASIGAVTELILNKAKIVSGHTWDATNHQFLNTQGQEAKDKISISEDYYPILVAGQYVTSANASDISFAGKTAGTMSYDADTHTLTMDNVSGTYNGTISLIQTEKEELILIVTGTNSITAPHSCVIEIGDVFFNNAGKECNLLGDMWIQGGGTLTINNLGANINAIYGDDLYLKGGTTLNVQSDGYAVGCYFYIYNSSADLTGNAGGQYGAVYRMYHMEGCHVESPDSVDYPLYSSNFINAYTGNVAYPTHVVIKPGDQTKRVYPISFEHYDNQKYEWYDYYLTEHNCTHFTCPILKQGTVSYNATTKVLTMNNVLTDTLTRLTLYETGVTLEVTGTNNMTYGYYNSSAFSLNPNVTIQGNGSLNLLGGITMYGPLTIRNTTVSVQSGYVYGGSPDDGYTTDLKIINSDVELNYNHAYYTLYQLNSLMLEDCEIVDPVGAELNEEGNLEWNGDAVSYCRIERTGTGIEEINENENVRKLLRNGQLLIIRDGKTYNAQGGKME